VDRSLEVRSLEYTYLEGSCILGSERVQLVLEELDRILLVLGALDHILLVREDLHNPEEVAVDIQAHPAKGDKLVNINYGATTKQKNEHIHSLVLVDTVVVVNMAGWSRDCEEEVVAAYYNLVGIRMAVFGVVIVNIGLGMKIVDTEIEVNKGL
jgi:hypothetical protein